jgi:hypothetical protein
LGLDAPFSGHQEKPSVIVLNEYTRGFEAEAVDLRDNQVLITVAFGSRPKKRTACHRNFKRLGALLLRCVAEARK